MRFITFLFLFLICYPNLSFAAAWLKKTGEHQLIHQFTYYGTDEFFDSSENRRNTADFSKSEYQIYYEQGWGPDLTIGATGRLQKLSQDLPSGEDTNIGIPELEFFARFPLFEDNKQVVSVQPLLKIPNPDADNNTPRLGSNDFDGEARLLYGRNIKGGKAFVNLEFAYRYRGGTSSDEIRFDPTYGYHYSDKWMFLAQNFNTYSLGNGTNKSLQITNSEDYDLNKLQGSAVYKINEGLSFQFGLFSNVYGKNTGAGGGAFIGLWQEF